MLRVGGNVVLKLFSQVGTEMVGVIDETVQLPDERCPSEHTLVALEVRAKPIPAAAAFLQKSALSDSVLDVDFALSNLWKLLKGR